MPLFQQTLRQIALCVAPSPAAGEIRRLAHPMSAGFPSPAADYAEEGLDLNDYLIRNKPATFLFTVRGDSMIGASIEDGDQVIVDRALTPNSYDIVVAVVAGEYTLKRLRLFADRAELHAENRKYPPIVIGEGGELQIWGVVTGVVRRYARRG
jgi:DNA polymerase V